MGYGNGKAFGRGDENGTGFDSTLDIFSLGYGVGDASGHAKTNGVNDGCGYGKGNASCAGDPNGISSVYTSPHYENCSGYGCDWSKHDGSGMDHPII